ncbi:MAG TPA: cyclic pyranopterin monophosphate synthase MoaC [Polyangiales bacterium]
MARGNPKRSAATRRSTLSGSPRTPLTLTHLDERGRAHMVDVGDKPVSVREAVARGVVRMLPATLETIVSGTAKKGDVLAVARIAGIQASKRTPELIPLCHAIALTGCEVRFNPEPEQSLLRIEASVRALDRTGAEMEALTAVAVAALTVYDMLKSIDREMSIDEIALYEKRGGKSGDFQRARAVR